MRLETRLHRARLDRGMDLADLAVRTRLSPHVLRKIDEGRFAELPAGIYARSYVRAFASAVGLEPNQVVRELEDVLPPAQDPLDGLREVVEQARPVRRSIGQSVARWAAKMVDAALLLVMNAVLIQTIAAACALDPATLLDRAGAALAMFCVIPAALYFVVFAGVGGRTPGAWLCGLPQARAATPLRVETILRRAIHSLIPDPSSLIATRASLIASESGTAAPRVEGLTPRPYEPRTAQ